MKYQSYTREDIASMFPPLPKEGSIEMIASYDSIKELEAV